MDGSADLRWSLTGSRDTLDASSRVARTAASGTASSASRGWSASATDAGSSLLRGHWHRVFELDLAGAGGLGYSFDWGDLSLSLRSLSYEFDKDDADLRMTGPALGVTFRW